MIVLLAAILSGLTLNLAFSSTLIQPDWALALLAATLLVHRGNWPWVLPAGAIHDLILHGEPGVSFLMLALMPTATIWLDAVLGAGLPQRLLLAASACLSLPLEGWSWTAAPLTFLLCLVAWHRLAARYATA
ncbi:MAG: hypothetical protein R8K47_07595 [Mariprofundaceae bacterium]